MSKLVINFTDKGFIIIPVAIIFDTWHILFLFILFMSPI